MGLSWGSNQQHFEEQAFLEHFEQAKIRPIPNKATKCDN